MVVNMLYMANAHVGSHSCSAADAHVAGAPAWGSGPRCDQVRNGTVVRILATTPQEASADPGAQHLFAKVSLGLGSRAALTLWAVEGAR